MENAKNADDPYSFDELEETYKDVLHWKGAVEGLQVSIRVEEGKLKSFQEEMAKAEASFAKAKAEFSKRAKNSSL